MTNNYFKLGAEHFVFFDDRNAEDIELAWKQINDIRDALPMFDGREPRQPCVWKAFRTPSTPQRLHVDVIGLQSAHGLRDRVTEFLGLERERTKKAIHNLDEVWEFAL